MRIYFYMILFLGESQRSEESKSAVNEGELFLDLEQWALTRSATDLSGTISLTVKSSVT